MNLHDEGIFINDINVYALDSGHVLGAAMFMIEIAGVKVLYTGDFSRVEDRHLMAAEIPSVTPDILITVSWNGGGRRGGRGREGVDGERERKGDFDLESGGLAT